MWRRVEACVLWAAIVAAFGLVLILVAYLALLFYLAYS